MPRHHAKKSVIKLLLCLDTMPKNQSMYQSAPPVLRKDRLELDDTPSSMMYQQHTHWHNLQTITFPEIKKKIPVDFMHYADMHENNIDAIKCGEQEGRHCISYVICPVIS